MNISYKHRYTHQNKLIIGVLYYNKATGSLSFVIGSSVYCTFTIYENLLICKYSYHYEYDYPMVGPFI